MRKIRGRKLSEERSGFTLLELLVVIAILAIISGGMLVAYVGLEDSAGAGNDAFNSSGIDRAVRTYKSVNTDYATNLDSLHNNNGTAALLDRLDTGLSARLTMSTLVAADRLALVVGSLPTEQLHQERMPAGRLFSFSLPRAR